MRLGAGGLNQFRSEQLDSRMAQPRAFASVFSTHGVGIIPVFCAGAANRGVDADGEHPPTGFRQIGDALLDGGHVQAKAESLEDIVVADHLHVLRHLQSTLGKALAESQGHHIVAAEHCRGTAVDNSIGSMISAVETVVTRNAQCGIETLPRLFDGIHETTFAIKRARFPTSPVTMPI